LLIFSTFYLVVIKITRNMLRADSAVISYESVKVQKLLQEGLGGIRDVLINNSQSFFCGLYKKSDASLRNAQARASFIGSTPKFILESLGMLCVSLAAYFFSNAGDGNIVSTIPLLGAFALGAQKMLPAAQQIYGSWVYIQSGTASLNDVLALLNQKIPILYTDIGSEDLKFNYSIDLSKIFFRYSDDQQWIISDLSFSIAKGERLGVIGPTGCGKSTLLDILMGLLIPASGNIVVDGRPITASNLNALRGLIAHVPQYIYLSDASIAENIAFGCASDAINMTAVISAAKLAQIHEVVEGLPNKYKSLVGERGVRLSGGQRQRIGLARALYRDSQVIIFDEATSALDDGTEAAVMDSVMKLDRKITIVIVAHRTSTLRECDSIIQFGAEGVRKISQKERLALR
jgi:ATP-binding cassette subfamily B protein